MPTTPPPVVEAPPEKLRRLRELRREVQAARAAADASRDVFGVLDYTPTARQEVFHAAREFDVLYGGAAGGGKSKALLMEGLRACVRHPGIRVVAFRRTYPELEESLLAELAAVDYARPLGARYDQGRHDLRFDNGSLFMFRYARNLPDATVRQGGQYQLLIIDELALMPTEVAKFLTSRVRSGDPRIPVLGIRCGSNPGGAGHGDARQRYIVGTDYGEKVYTDERGRTVRFVPAKLDDNPHLNPEYARDLDGLPEQMRAAFRDGSWDSFAGQAFGEWRRDRIVVPRFEIPDGWARYGGMDYGYAAPATYLAAARDQDGRMWVFRELTMVKTAEREQARMILAAEQHLPARSRFADPAMWGQTGSALPPATQMAADGLALIPADNDRIGGKMRVHTYLTEAPACPHHRAAGWATCPLLHVLDGTAPELVRTMPDLPVDPKKPEDVDTLAEDHHYDALRYLLMGVGVAPVWFAPETRRPPLVPPEDLRVPWHQGTAVDGDPTVLPGPSRGPSNRSARRSAAGM